MGEPTDEPTLYVIRDPSVVVVSTDYHIAKGVGRALAYILDHAVSIRCGHQEVTTVILGDYPPAGTTHAFKQRSRPRLHDRDERDRDHLPLVRPHFSQSS